MSNRKTGITAVIQRELSRMVSRPIYLATIFVIPLICYVFFITLLYQGLPNKMPVAVVDLDNTSTSRLLVRQIDATQGCQVVGKQMNFSEALYLMQEGTIYAFVVIPENFQTNIFTGKQPDVAYYTQNTYYVAGSLLMKDLSTTLASVSAGINLKMYLSKGWSMPEAMALIQPIQTDINEMGNAWISYSVYLSTIMLPGTLQLMILIVTVFGIGLELKEKTARQWMLTSGKSVTKALIGKTLPYTLIFILLAGLGNIVMFGFLEFPFSGSHFQMFLGTVLFVLAQQALGIFIIGMVPVLRDSLSFCAILGTLAISFSGLTFPIEGMLPGIQAWSVAFPLRHYFLIYVSQALTGAGMAVSWHSYLILMAFLVLPLLVMIRLKKAFVRQNYPTG